MKKSFIPSFVLLIFISLSACKKEVPYAEEGKVTVTITFNNPKEGQKIVTGEEVHIEGIIDADALLSGWKTTVVALPSGDTLDRHEEHYEQTQFVVHHHFFVPQTNDNQLQITIDALSSNYTSLGHKTIVVTH